jgi:hypothetical protein
MAHVFKVGLSYCPVLKLKGFLLNNKTTRKVIYV